MKIGIIGLAYPFRGGISHFNTNMYWELKKNNDVRFYSFNYQYPEMLFPGKSQKDYSDKSYKIGDEPIYNPLNPFSWIRTIYHIRKDKREKIVFSWWVIHFGPSFFGTCSLIKLFTKAKILFVTHNVIPHENKIVDRIISRMAFLFVDEFICLSKEVQNELLDLKPKAKTLYNPHPMYSMFKDNSPRKEDAKNQLKLSDKKVILYFGYIRKYKGMDNLIKAMKHVSRKDAYLIIAGECYDDSVDYRKLICQLGLKDRVLFKDEFVPNKLVDIYFSAADVVVCPYNSASQSGVVQIAYSYDKPVIVTDVGGLPEVVKEGKTGYVAKPRDPKDLAMKITKFFDSEIDFAAEIKEYKKIFGWDKLVEKVVSFDSYSLKS